MKKLFILLIVIFCIACSFEIYAFIDTTEPIIVEQQLSKTEYVVGYNYDNKHWYMHIITNEDLKVGDTLQLIKK